MYDQNPWNGGLDKLFELKSTEGDIKLKSAEVDADGKVIGLKSQTIDILLETEQVKKAGTRRKNDCD